MERLKVYKTSILILLFYFSFKFSEFVVVIGITDKYCKEFIKVFLNNLKSVSSDSFFGITTMSQPFCILCVLINKLLNLLLIKFLLCALPTDLETDSPNLVMPNVLDLTDTSISGLLNHFPKL